MIDVRGPLTPERIALANENLGLIDLVLRKHPRFSNDYQDAWQDGYFGLLRATADWDPARSRFSTYAYNWIRGGLSRGLYDYEGTSWRAGQDGRYEWHRPESLDQPISDDGTTTIGDLIPEPERPDDTPDPALAARVRLIHEHCRDDLDRAIVANLANGIGAVRAALDAGFDGSLASKRVARLRARIARSESAA